MTAEERTLTSAPSPSAMGEEKCRPLPPAPVTQLGASPDSAPSAMVEGSIELANVIAWKHGREEQCSDTLTVEEPLEIRLAGISVAVTMRTPGDDHDLAAGFLFTEGIIHHPSDIASIAHCPTDDADSRDNIININPVSPELVEPERWRRNFAATSSCGICGKVSIDTVRQRAAAVASDLWLSAGTLLHLEVALQERQDVFKETGGLHAAALFDRERRAVVIREDIGRHNAVDKVIGHAFRTGMLPLDQHILVVSSRASFEVTQKALMAGIPVVATVSAPSSLAVELAQSAGMTLVGFLRPGRFNIYCGEERIIR